MSTKKNKLDELTDKESFIRIVHHTRLNRLVDDVVSVWPQKVHHVLMMNPYRQIEFLEEVVRERPQEIQPVTLTSISYFLEEVHPYRERFWTAE